MIHVHKDFDAVPKSLQLTEEEYTLLKEGKELNKSYYEQDVLDALTEVYGGKCAYCEQKIHGWHEEGINRYNILHYRPPTKELYPWLMYEWSNLLLVCKDCLDFGRFRSYDFKILGKRITQTPENVQNWRANSELLLSEKPLLLHPEVNKKIDSFFTLDIKGVLFPTIEREKNLIALFTIHFASLNRNRLQSARRKIIRTYLDKDDFSSEQHRKETIKSLEKETTFQFTKLYLSKNFEKLKHIFKSFKFVNNKMPKCGNWLTNLTITKLRHLELVNIPISSKEKKHLIITGKNGSGKTTVLENLNAYLIQLLNHKEHQEVQHIRTIEGGVRQVIETNNSKPSLTDLSMPFGFGVHNSQVFEWGYPLFIELNRYIENIIEQYKKDEFIYLYFPDRRLLEVKEIDINPNGKIDLKRKINDTRKDDLSQDLQNFLVRLNIVKIASIANENLEERKLIENWLEDFTSKIRNIFEDDSLSIEFPMKGLDFDLKFQSEKYNSPLSFEYLPMGYSAFLKIAVEIIMNIVGKKGWESINYDIEGIVLIDEVSAHLHVDLQKQVLPILTDFFPNIQFIVTTHSPFVLNSIDGAIVYDLENHHTFESNTKYSTSGIIETHFHSDGYSKEVKGKLKIYRGLIEKEKLTDREEHEKNTLESYFEDVKSFLSPELKFILGDIQLKEAEKKYIEKMEQKNG